MTREIFEVYAKVVDANGTLNTLSGYPKVFDSKNYDNNTAKTQLRAEGEFAETYGAMCKRDDRQLQVVMLLHVNDGAQMDCKYIGKLPEFFIEETDSNISNE